MTENTVQNFLIKFQVWNTFKEPLTKSFNNGNENNDRRPGVFLSMGSHFSSGECWDNFKSRSKTFQTQYSTCNSL